MMTDPTDDYGFFFIAFPQNVQKLSKMRRDINELTIVTDHNPFDGSFII